MQALTSSNSVNIQSLSRQKSADSQQTRARVNTEEINSVAPVAPHERFDVDKQTMVLLDQQALKQGNKASLTSAQFDQPSEQNLSAINAYQAVSNLPARANIEQLFGVDLFA